MWAIVKTVNNIGNIQTKTDFSFCQVCMLMGSIKLWRFKLKLVKRWWWKMMSFFQCHGTQPIGLIVSWKKWEKKVNHCHFSRDSSKEVTGNTFNSKKTAVLITFVTSNNRELLMLLFLLDLENRSNNVI